MTVPIRRKLASFLLFYRHIFLFSIMVAIVISYMEAAILSIQIHIPGVTDQVIDIHFFLRMLAKRYPTYIFIGALGLTHFVQKKQYYYYRNQGLSIVSLIFSSWLMNSLIGGVIFIFGYVAGSYV